MDIKNKKGFTGISRKSLSVIAASVAVIAGNQAQANPVHVGAASDSSSTIAFKTKLKPRLVLKLNMSAPEKSIVSMHTSHASHASHASHTSSSPAYTPTYTPVTPAYTPTSREERIPTRTVVQPSTYTNTAVSVDTARTLYKGLNGADVKRMQQLLKDKGYDVPVSGYFGQQTDVAVKKFQKKNDLPTDGKVGGLTMSMLAN